MSTNIHFSHWLHTHADIRSDAEEGQAGITTDWEWAFLDNPKSKVYYCTPNYYEDASTGAVTYLESLFSKVTLKNSAGTGKSVILNDDAYLEIDTALQFQGAGTYGIISGGGGTFYFYANSISPALELANSYMSLKSTAVSGAWFEVYAPSSYPDIVGATLYGTGVLEIHEVSSTPATQASYGKVYTKDDNLLYFQDGAGTEHVLIHSTSGAVALTDLEAEYIEASNNTGESQLRLSYDSYWSEFYQGTGGLTLLFDDGDGAITFNAGLMQIAEIAGVAARIRLQGTSGNIELELNGTAGLAVGGYGNFLTNGSDVLCNNTGVLALKEITTPTADTNYGKVYCKNDNKLYFQDGAGTEHEVSLDINNEFTTIILEETTTPTPVADSGQVYTKSDNKLYFQDGAGTEHEVIYETSGIVNATNLILTYNGAQMGLVNGAKAVYFQRDTGDNLLFIFDYSAEGQIALKAGEILIYDKSGVGGFVTLQNDAGSSNVRLDGQHGLIVGGTSPLTNESDILCNNNGTIALKEISTPTADANYGKVYCKSDNKLYFQDGAGTEHEIDLDGAGGGGSEFTTVTLEETTTPTPLADHGKVYTKSDNKLYFQDGAGTEHTLPNIDSGYLNLTLSGSYNGIKIYNYSSSASNVGEICFYASETDTEGANVATTDDDLIGQIFYYGNSGSGFIPAANIRVVQEGTITGSYVPSRIDFIVCTASGYKTPLALYAQDAQALFIDSYIGMKRVTSSVSNARSGYGYIYPKTDDNLYFYDGAGAEHQVATSIVFDSYDNISVRKSSFESWPSSSYWAVFQLGSTFSFINEASEAAGNGGYWINNAYWDGSNWRVIKDDETSMIEMRNGRIDFNSAYSPGSDDGTFSYSRVASIDLNGIYSGSDGAYNCGISGGRWNYVYAVNGTIQTSDGRKKKDIEDDNLGLDFIKSIRPIKFKRKDVVEDDKVHHGFSAQEIESIISQDDFAGIVYDAETDVYGLNYSEFISPLVRAIQELSARIDDLEKVK